MIRCIAGILIATAPALATGETIETPLFILELPAGWVIEHDADPPPPEGVYRLVFDHGDTAATISAMTFGRRDSEALANEYLDIRLQAEREVNEELGMTITLEEAFEDKGDGHQIEYFGSDSSGRRFRYWGFIRDTKLINIYVETYELPEESLQATFREILAGLRF